jgi:hypothetical protein
MTSDSLSGRRARSRRGSPQDSADATQLIRLGAPTACPTCGARTRPADTPEGWMCLAAACVWSAPAP